MIEQLFVKCKKCGAIYEKKKLIDNLYVCIECGHYENINCFERLNLIADKGSFEETNRFADFIDPIDFPGYKEKFKNAVREANLNEAIITGKAKINGYDVMIGIMDSRFIMGSMGIIVGEKVARLFEDAELRKLPVILFSASGGARMQEGIFSLMQMAKTAGVISKFRESGGLFISVLTNPTTGGVSASFAFLGDIIIAEPKALIGFAGKRVIEQTIKEKLPDNFQTAEFLLDHGFIDIIVERKELKDILTKLLKIHNCKKSDSVK